MTALNGGTGLHSVESEAQMYLLSHSSEAWVCMCITHPAITLITHLCSEWIPLKILLQILDEHLRLIGIFSWIKTSGKSYSLGKMLLRGAR